MAGRHHGGPGQGRGAHRRLNGLGAGRIHAGGGLVQQQDQRAQDQPGGQGHALLFAAGKRLPGAAQHVLSRREAHSQHGFLGGPPQIPAAAAHTQAVDHVLKNRGFEQIGFLQQQGDVLPGRTARRAVKTQFAGSGTFQKGQQAQQGALARAVGTRERQHFAASNAQLRQAQHCAPPVALRQGPALVQHAHAPPPRPP